MAGSVPAQRVAVRNDNFDYKKFLRLCLDRWWWFAISFCVVAVTVFGFIKLNPQPETIKGSVLIASNSSDTKSSLLKQFDVSSVLGGTGSVESEVAIMSSHEVMMMTVRQLQLNCKYTVKKGLFKTYEPWGDEPVRLDYDQAMADTLSAALMFKLKLHADNTADVTMKCAKDKFLDEKNVKLPATFDTPYGKFALAPTEYFDSFFAKRKSLEENIVLSNYSASAESFQKAIVVAPYSKKVNLVNISFKTFNVNYGVDVLTALVENYNKLGIENQREKGLRTIKFIDERIAELSDDLSDKEAQIESFTSGKLVGNVEADAKRSFERSSKLQDALVNAETEYQVMQMISRFISDPANRFEMLPSVGETQSKALAGSIEKYNTEILQRVNMLKNASPDNISVKNLEDNLDALRNNIELSLSKALEAAGVRLQSLRSQAYQARSKELDLPETQREYLVLKRNQGIQEKLYLYLLQQREEKAMSVANVTPSAQVIDQIYVTAYAAKRSKKVYALLVLIIGFGIPAVIIFFIDRMRRTVDSAKEVKLLTSLPMLASVSAEKIDDQASLWARPVQANLGFILGASGGNTVMVTSMGQDEARGKIAVAIARQFASQGDKTLLLQADMNHEEALGLGVRSRGGVVEYVAGRVSLDDIVTQVPSVAGLSVITGTADGVSAVQSLNIIASPKFKKLLDKVKVDYDVVVIDAPAIGETGYETAVIAADSSVVVLVATEGVTRIDDLERLRELNSTGIYHNLSVVYTEA